MAAERRLRGIEGLRALAALSVLAHHLAVFLRTQQGTAVPLPGPTETALSDLRWGLVLFFALSGFLLWRPVAAAVVRGRATPDPRTFLRNRALRILPAYWVVLVVTALALGAATVNYPFVVGRITDPAMLLADLALVQTYRPEWVGTGIGPAWSLAVEAVFYLTVPVFAAGVVLLVARRDTASTRAWALCLPALVLLVLGLATKVAVLLAGPLGAWTPVADLAFPRHADLFAFGMLAAVLHARVDAGQLVFGARERRRAAWGAAALGTLALLAVGRAGPVQGDATDTVVAAAFGLALAAVATPRAPGESASRALALLEWRPLVLVGLASYSVYLWHVPVLLGLGQAGAAPAGLAGFVALSAAAVLLTAVASWATYRWVEVPALALKGRRLGALPHPVASTPTASVATDSAAP